MSEPAQRKMDARPELLWLAFCADLANGRIGFKTFCHLRWLLIVLPEKDE